MKIAFNQLTVGKKFGDWIVTDIRGKYEYLEEAWGDFNYIYLVNIKLGVSKMVTLSYMIPKDRVVEIEI